MYESIFFWLFAETSMSDSSYEEPASYRVDSVIAVSKENRWHSLQRQKPHPRKPVGVQMKGQTLGNRKAHHEASSGKAASQRAQSMQSILPPSYESVVGKRPLSGAVPVAIPHVPSDPRFSRSVSEDTSLSKYAVTSKSTPNLDKTNGDGFQTGPGSPPKDAKRNMSYNRPFSYVEPDTYASRTQSTSDVEKVVATPAKASVVAVEASDSKPELTVLATPVEVIEASAEVAASSPRSPEKPPIPPKPPSLSDALQEALAARTERMSRRTSDAEIDRVQRSRKSSAPAETDTASSSEATDFRDRKMSAPAKFSARKKLEASQKVRTEIMTSLEEKFTEDESGGEKSLIKAKQNGRFDLDARQREQYGNNTQKTISSPSSKDEKNCAASSADIYRRYTNPAFPTRDMNRQFSLDSCEVDRKTSSTTSGRMERQLSEPVSFDYDTRAHVTPKPINGPAPAAPPPPQIQLSVCANASRGVVPPAPPVVLPNASTKDIPVTPVSKGIITADALAAKKMNLKSAPKDMGVDVAARKHSAPASGNSRNFAVEHSSLLAKAIAARAARVSAQPHPDTDLSATSQSAQQTNKSADERRPGSPDRINKKGVVQLFEARGVNSRGKPSPPVAPKKRLSSPDLRHRRYGGNAERPLPFDIPAPVLSEEDRSVMMLDEVIRKEAESENWSLNSWNSGSDSSSEVFVPPPVWSSENQDNVSVSRPWYECSSPSEESITKAPEPEKFNKTITTKKGFKIQLTFETKKEESPKPSVTSPSTDFNDVDPVVPAKLTSADSPSRTDLPKETLVQKEAISNERENHEATNIAEPDNIANEDTNFGVPPPPLLFTDIDEPYTPLDSPPLPPPPEFSPREPKPTVLKFPEDEEEDSSSVPSSARSDDSDKV